MIRSPSLPKIALPGPLIGSQHLSAPAARADSLPAPITCERACLYGVLDDYLARDEGARSIPGALGRASEDHGEQRRAARRRWLVGHDHRARCLRDAIRRSADRTGRDLRRRQKKPRPRSPYALRLKVVNGAVAKRRRSCPAAGRRHPLRHRRDDGQAGVRTSCYRSPANPARADDCRRQRLFRYAAAQRRHAARRVHRRLQPPRGWHAVDEQCRRRTWTRSPDSGCADQFRLGQYRYDDRLRDRRFIAVDEERGIVLAAAFIDHEGRLGDFKLTDGTHEDLHVPAAAFVRAVRGVQDQGRQDPRRGGRVHTVPYNMPSPWDN